MQLCKIFSLGLLTLFLHAFNGTSASVEEYSDYDMTVDQISEETTKYPRWYYTSSYLAYEATTATNSEESTTSPQWYSTPITSSARPTPATTAASAMAPRVPSEEELQAQSLLNETQGVIDSTQLHFYQRKTQLSLNFINKAIPALQEIKHNMSNLLNASASYSYTSFKKANDVLENELTEVEKGMKRNRASVERYLSVYNVMTQKIREVHGTLGEILLPGANDNSITSPDLYASSALASQSVPVNTGPVTIGTGSDCGGILKADSGSISYKVGQALSPNEGCLWVIQAASNTSAHFAFKLRSSGFITTRNTFLSVGYFKDAEYSEAETFIWQKIVPGSGSYDIVAEAPVAFVHFVSSPPHSVSAAANRGFQLEFQLLTGASTTTTTLQYKNEFIRGPRGTRRYPQSGQYVDNERSVIVLQPTLSSSGLQMNWWDFEGTTVDSLSIWSFGTDLMWSRLAKLGGNRDTSSVVRIPPQGPRNDPFLLVFRSDSSVVRDGFEFEWGPQ